MIFAVRFLRLLFLKRKNSRKIYKSERFKNPKTTYLNTLRYILLYIEALYMRKNHTISVDEDIWNSANNTAENMSSLIEELLRQYTDKMKNVRKDIKLYVDIHKPERTFTRQQLLDEYIGYLRQNRPYMQKLFKEGLHNQLGLNDAEIDDIINEAQKQFEAMKDAEQS